MPDVAHLDVVISADTRGFDAGIKHVETEAKGLGASVSSGIGAGIGFSVFEKGLSALAAGFGAAKGSVIDLNSSLEQSKIAFTTMLGSAQKADDFLDSLAKFAAETPFEFPDLVNASKRMFAFGFAAKDVVPLLTAVGDAVAAVGGGADVIDGVTTALGQMQAKGKVSAEEMNQLAERGIPAWDMLAKKMGVSVAEAMDASAKGQVKAATMLAAFQEGSAARFGGMMAKQSKTFAGAMSTIKDTLQMAMARAFKPFFDMLSAGAVSVASFLSSSEFSGWADAATTAIAGLIASGADLVTWLVSALRPAWEWVIDNADDIMAVFTGAAAGIGALLASSAVVPIIGAVGAALTALLSPIALVAAAGAALALAWRGNWFGIRDVTATVVGWLTTTVWPGLLASMAILQTWIATTFVPTFQGVVTWLRDTLGFSLTWLTTTAWPGLQVAMTTVWSWMETTLVPSLTGVWTWLQEKLGGALTWLTTVAWPAMGNAANAVQNWINETLVPGLTTLWGWLSETGDKAVGAALVWLRDKGWPLMKDAALAVWGWIKDPLIPTLRILWEHLSESVGGALTWLTTTGWPLMKDAALAVWGWIKDPLFPTLHTLWEHLSEAVGGALTWLTTVGWPNMLAAMTTTVDYIRDTTIPWFRELHSELEKKGAYDDIAVSATNIWNALRQINQYLPGTAQGFSEAVQPANDFAAGIKNITAAFRAWSETGPFDIVDAFNEAVFTIRHTIWEGMKAIADAAEWVADAMGTKVPDWFGHLPSEPERPSPVQRPSGSGGGSGGGGGGGSPSNPPPVAPPSNPPPVAPPSNPPPVAPPSNPPPVAPTPAPPPSGSIPSPGGPSVGTQNLGGGVEVENYIRSVASQLGIDPSVAVAVANTEGGARSIMRIGDFRGPPWYSGVSYWPFQLHYGGAGTPYAAWGGAAGMGNQFTRETGEQAGDPNAWKASVLFGLGEAKKYGWGQWYGPFPPSPNAIPGFTRWTGISGHAAGGWVGLHGPELGMLGERGPEYVIPHHALRGGGAPESMTINVAVGGRIAEQIYVEGRDLAIRRGRAPAGVA